MPGELLEFVLMADQFGGSVETDAAPYVQLIARARAGELAAFDELMMLHQRRVLTLAWRLLGDADLARDAAQEAFLRVYKNLHRYDSRQDFSGWLYRIAVNVCRDHYRKVGRHRDASFETELASGALREPVSGDDTEAAAMLAQQQRMLWRGLASLTEKERAAIVLRDLEGFTTEEVAQMLGSSATTVRSQISSARVKLKKFREQWLQGKRR